jgi:3-phosphoglycerate kinase
MISDPDPEPDGADEDEDTRLRNTLRRLLDAYARQAFSRERREQALAISAQVVERAIRCSNWC